MSNWFMSAVTGMILERPGKKLTVAEHVEKLAQGGQELARQIGAADDTPPNREALRHIVGIERWSQRRLRVALGEDLVEEEHMSYRPADHLDWDMLQAQFQSTRAETVALARQLDEASVNAEMTIPHNQFGKVSVLGWLQYIDSHARRESKRIR